MSQNIKNIISLTFILLLYQLMFYNTSVIFKNGGFFMQRIEELRKLPLKASLIPDEFFYVFYKKFSNIL